MTAEPGRTDTGWDDGERRPIPDPTSLTTENLTREINHLKELLEGQISFLRGEFEEYKAGHVERHHEVVNGRIEAVRVSTDDKIVALRTNIEQKAVDLDLRYQQRYDAQKEALAAALVAQQTAVEAAFKAQQEAISAALTAVDKAATRIETTTEKKFHLVDQSMATVAMLSDKTEKLAERIEAIDRITDAKFVTYRTLLDSEAEKVKLALDANDKALSKADVGVEKRFEGVDLLRRQVNEQANTFVPRQESDQRFTSLGARVDAMFSSHDVMLADIKSRLDRTEGKSGGYSASGSMLVGGIGVIATLITIVTAIILVVN